jgi:hypothetical protein
MNKRLISEFYLTLATTGEKVAHAGRPAVPSGKGYPGSYTTACGLELDPIPVYEVLQHITCPACVQLLYGETAKRNPESDIVECSCGCGWKAGRGSDLAEALPLAETCTHPNAVETGLLGASYCYRCHHWVGPAADPSAPRHEPKHKPMV